MGENMPNKGSSSKNRKSRVIKDKQSNAEKAGAPYTKSDKHSKAGKPSPKKDTQSKTGKILKNGGCLLPVITTLIIAIVIF